MTRPWKHPDSGYYWFRKRVPEDLRDLVGKREERFSLGTRDPSEAKRLHALKLAEVEERWSNLRNGHRPLSPDDIAREAAAIGDQLRRQLETDPYQPLRWDVEIGASLWAISDAGDFYTDITQPLSPADGKRLSQRDMCYALVDERLAVKGLATQADDRERLARAVSLELQRIVQDHQGYLLGKPQARTILGIPSTFRVPPAPLTFEAIIQGWLVEKKPNKKTEYTWRRVMNELSAFLEHADARRVHADDLVRWKADLLAKSLKAKTIRDSKLAPVRAIFQWAVDNRKLDSNPAARINIDLKARSSEKRRGYTDDEAKLPLIHVTAVGVAREIVDSGKLEARVCSVFNRGLLYFFAMRAAYRLKDGDAKSHQINRFPFVFIVRPEAVPAPYHVYPFDTGGAVKGVFEAQSDPYVLIGMGSRRRSAS